MLCGWCKPTFLSTPPCLPWPRMVTRPTRKNSNATTTSSQNHWRGVTRCRKGGEVRRLPRIIPCSEVSEQAARWHRPDGRFAPTSEDVAMSRERPSSTSQVRRQRASWATTRPAPHVMLQGEIHPPVRIRPRQEERPMIRVTGITKRYGETLAVTICRLTSSRARSPAFSGPTVRESRPPCA